MQPSKQTVLASRVVGGIGLGILLWRYLPLIQL
jgi:hypothetical protein